MRAIAPFFAVIASCATIFATVVRLWWSKPKPLTRNGQQMYDLQDQPMVRQPKASPGLRKAATWWLYLVAACLTVGVVVVAVVFVVRIIEISS